MSKRSDDTHQEIIRQVDEPRRGVLPTFTHDYLLSVSAVATPGGQSFRQRQQRLSKRQQSVTKWMNL